MKRTALALTFIFALQFSVVGAQFVGLVEANGYLYRMGFEDIDPLPGTIPPKITILNPKNHTTYSVSDLSLTVHVARPVTPCSARFGPLHVKYFLDGWRQDTKLYSYPSSEVDINTVLYDLRSGSHELVVQVICYVEPVNMAAVFRIDSTSTVFFTIDDTLSSPSPSPSPLSTPTPEPTPYEEPQSTGQDIAAGTVFAVTSVVVFLGLLVCFIKKRQSQALSAEVVFNDR